jgi:hypothetical protein
MKLTTIIISVLLNSLLLSNLFAQIQTPDFSQSLLIRNDYGDTSIVFFGLDHLATDGIDAELGELELPPLPPLAVWDVRLVLPPNNWGELTSWLDYRNEINFPYTGQREYRLQYQIGENTNTLFIEWNFPPELTGVLQDLIVGTLVNVQMQGSGSFSMQRGVSPDPLLLSQLKLMINYNNVVAGINPEAAEHVPDEFILEQNFPNPFNPTTTINFSLPSESDIVLKVFDVLGNEVSQLVEGRFTSGEHSVVFDASSLSSGIYIYQLRSEMNVITKKMTLLK